MIKILVETPRGVQELIEIDVSGSYYEAARVTWDERVNGPFPPALIPEVGGLVRSGPGLVVDAAKKAAYLAAKAAAAAAKAASETEDQTIRQRIRDYDDDTATPAQQKQHRKDIAKAVKKLLGG